MKKILFTVSATLVVLFASGQMPTLHRNLNWKAPVETAVTESENIKSLYFTGASYDENNIPVFRETILLEGNVQSATVDIENAVYAKLDEAALISPQSVAKMTSAASVEVGLRKKKSYAVVTVPAIRKSATGQLEKLISFDLKISPTALRNGNPNQISRTYTQSSVLASGEWYKLGVTQNGVHKITYQQLKNLGLAVDQIDPRNLKIYGNGAGQLAYLNSTPRYDDLKENAIYVEGEADGQFNDGDYILFYGQKQVTWTYNSTTGIFNHSVNEYSDTTYYFVTASLPAGKRIQSRASSSSTPTHTINSFDEHEFHEADLYNFLKSGREWYGENFDLQRTFQTFDFYIPNILSSAADLVKVNAAVIGRSFSDEGNFNLFCNGQLIDSKTTAVTNTSVTADYAKVNTLGGSITSCPESFSVRLNFASTDQSAGAWLDYIEVNARRRLDFSGAGDQIIFRDSRSAGSANTGQFEISNATASTRIWDITDPINIARQQTSQGNGTFVYPTDIIREYVAFNGNSFQTPAFIGRMANQNLHAMQQAQLIIVTNPKFLSEATRLAEFHRTHDGYNVNVATTTQIFNEFSSGSQDVCAIRDFIKMFFDRSTSPADLPRFALMFGDASYDNKYRLSNNTNFVTAYQSESSLNQTTTYISDDFFGLMDENEGIWSPWGTAELMDISIGRLPVKSTVEAEAMVNKIVAYATPVVSSNSSETNLSDWRNIVAFVGDDQDNNTHFSQSETLANTVKAANPVYNVDKIYLDAYKQISTPGGQRFPDARSAIVNRVQRGALLMTYIGHGGEVGWAHERVLENEDINGWTNIKHMPAFLTATCEFSRPDDPGRTSAGELVLLNPNGGGICLFTTTRLAFSGSNFSLAQRFFDHFFTPVNGIMPTCGEVFEQTKIDYNDRYTRNFVLLGDPAVRLAYPEYDVITNTVNAHPLSLNSDTLRALSKITITGEVRNKSGSKLTGFNGVVYPTIFDKSVVYSTLGNDFGWTGDGGGDFAAPFSLQKNILYKGKAQVHNGDFSFTFVVPKDISYQYGNGKISYYAHNGQNDANGYSMDIVVGGLNPNAGVDNVGPQVKLYLNDDKFVFGGLTDSDPVLYAEVSDSNGINTAGTGIGHDITATIDNDNAKISILNDYYESNLDSYQSGTVRYPYSGLASGRHTLTFKVWDVYNNSSDARTEFIVAETAQLALEHVLNYPNPFTTHTTFMFEHNRPYQQLSAQVQIFTVSGKLIKTLNRLITTEGYRSDDIEWDGLDDYGDRIGRGVYIYKLKVKDFNGSSSEKFEKLVILR
ncbi:MAG: type IX secretion system sortase PorU [Bacteroidetes bacterium]|nr:type IX secretion system sortase PorU [Bacteroidota bacterium]